MAEDLSAVVVVGLTFRFCLTSDGATMSRRAHWFDPETSSGVGFREDVSKADLNCCKVK